ncbi:MAG TPA: phosphatidate cytidylyltransferase [candidate division Zixibacteria bacterium]|nr:phosphatidate cytidylyltransferase [candidate division Zixibacteria bacterium]
MSKNLIARIAVAAVAIPIILWICYEGGAWLFGMLLLFAAIGAIEFFLGEGSKPTGGLFWIGLLTVAVNFAVISGACLGRFCPAETIRGAFGSLGMVVPSLFFFTFTAMILAVGKEPPSELFKRHSRIVWGVLYLSLLYPMVYRVGHGYADISGGNWLLFLFGLLWVGDTAAMWTGMAIGKHKLAPAVSPNKTIEGFIGGIAGALAVTVLMYFWKFNSFSFGHLLAIGAGCSVCGQLGDLVESMWKRSLGIKDSSALIPGHGGVLDRFDSLLFAAPFMYFYLRLLA